MNGGEAMTDYCRSCDGYEADVGKMDEHGWCQHCNYRNALEQICDQDPIENALDPQWAARIAKHALDAAALAAERVPEDEPGVMTKILPANSRARTVPTPITDEMVERLALHLLNEYRERGDVPSVASFAGFSDFAVKDWRDKARKLLAAALNGGER